MTASPSWSSPRDYAVLLAAIEARRHRGRPAPPAGRQGVRPHRRLRRARSPAGSPARPARSSPSASSCPARAAASCATARTRTSGPRSTPPAASPWAWPAAVQLQGKELSFNNLNDTDTAWPSSPISPQPAVAIIKHANPCGVAVGDSVARRLPQGAGLRPAQRVRRHRRLQPPARRPRRRARSPGSSPRS